MAEEAGAQDAISRSYFASGINAPPTKKRLAYGTILYIPDNFQIDFGANPRDWRTYKQRAPRMIFVSTWADARMGFPGGGVKRHESPSEAITRELFEELGENVSFTDADLQFSVVEGERVTFTFLQVWRDAAKFSSLLRAFEAEHTRKGYVNEVFSVCGLPLYFEAPAEYSKPMPWGTVHGLPKYLVENGGSFSATHNFVVRETMLLLLMKHSLLSPAVIDRLVGLSNTFEGSPCPTRWQLLEIPGVSGIVPSVYADFSKEAAKTPDISASVEGGEQATKKQKIN